MSKVNSVPRKQGRRLVGTDFVHFGVESLFARKLQACMNGIILSFPKLGELIYVKMTCRSREGVGHEVLSLVQGVGRAIFSYP